MQDQPHAQAPSGFRFNFGGLNTNDPPDAMGANKYPIAVNVRTLQGNSIQTRGGYTKVTGTENSRVTDIRAYTALQTDDLPRFLIRLSNNKVYLDDGGLRATLSGSSPSAFMIPYRPNQSPTPWMYIATKDDYKKISAPDQYNSTTTYDVGIQEQQQPPEACANSMALREFTNLAAAWTNAGTLGAIANGARVADTAGVILDDPGSGADKRRSVQVTTAAQYQSGMIVVFDAGGKNLHAIVQDVLPPINSGAAITISSIRYYSGTTGRCVIVPNQVPASVSLPLFDGNSPKASSIYSDSIVSGLRRSALIQIAGSTTEKMFIDSVTTGPDGTICFEVTTTGTFVAGDTITGLAAIVCSGINTAVLGDAISSPDLTAAVAGAGTAFARQTLAASPFNQLLDPTNHTPQEDDYIAFGINISDLSKFVQGTITFRTDGAAAYDTNGFYATFKTSDLIFHLPSDPQTTEITTTTVDFDGNIQQITEVVTNLTPLPASQWTTIMFPIRALQRLGNDMTRTLANCDGVQLSLQTTGAVNVAFGNFWIGGGNQPDVGNNGSPYFYVVRTRDPLTGATSNPSPIMRYGVSPRRQSVRVSMVDTLHDPQMKVWDVFRYGGTITSWRYLGSVANSAGGTDVFTDDYFNPGSLGLDYDNFEPWPTIDVPYIVTAGTVGLITTTIALVGTTVVITYSSANAFTSPFPSTIARWLPGTLVIVGGQSAYTLWNRPRAYTHSTPPAAFYYAYILEFTQHVGTGTVASLTVNEPNVANQHLPYLIGPNAQGDIFGCGDPYRPGNLYYIKSFNPDSAPQSYNQELTPPSEPLLGGEAIGGIVLVSSTKRWWAMMPALDTPQRYYAVERQIGRPLIAPDAKCTDGKRLFFWTKDGIGVTDGGAYASLTDDDLYNLFPHDSVQGSDVTYAGITIHAPDYTRIYSFRLTVTTSFLYADYQDSTGTQRTLVYDLNSKAWCVDQYADSISAHYALEQQEAQVLNTTSGTLYGLMVMGDSAGNLYRSTTRSNDNGTPITCSLATFEFNGGDLWSEALFGDILLDSQPSASSGIRCRPVSNGSLVSAQIVVPQSASRLRTPIKVNGTNTYKYLGLLTQWTDDFNSQSNPTSVFAWWPWVLELAPRKIRHWQTQSTSFGLTGYIHIQHATWAYISTSDITLTVTSYDGTSPQVIMLPATGGQYRKTVFNFTFNKGQLFRFDMDSAEDFQVYFNNCEIYVGQWDRQTPYTVFRALGAIHGDSSGGEG